MSSAHLPKYPLPHHVEAGDRSAVEQLFTAVYQELRDLAGRFFQNEPKANTLQPTALVHEAYVKLVDQTAANWQGRTHFFAVAAQAMGRRILVDRARQRGAPKGGGGQHGCCSTIRFPPAARRRRNRRRRSPREAGGVGSLPGTNRRAAVLRRPRRRGRRGLGNVEAVRRAGMDYGPRLASRELSQPP